MFRTILLIAVVALVAIAQQPVPSKPEWPNQWDSPFGLNIHNLLYKITNRSSHFYYNWDIKATRIAYPNGCIPYLTEKPCDLIFNPVGVYMLSPKDDKPCCLLLKNIGSVPPDFLKPFTYANQATVPNQYGDEIVTNHWEGPEGFEYWTAASNGIDIQFIYWNFGTINYVNQSASLFDLPSKCAKSCLFKDGTPLHKQMPESALHPHLAAHRAAGMMKRP